MTLRTRHWIPIVTVAVALVAGVALLVGISGDDPPPPTPDNPPPSLDDVLTNFAAGLRPDASYKPPTADERNDVVNALEPLLNQDAGPQVASSLRSLGFTLAVETDAATGRQYALVRSDRAWGVYVFDLSKPVGRAVEVPHPNSDLRTERMGLALFRAMPGSVLLVSGTHRRVERGDVAHRTDSAFHALAAELAARKVPQVQVHGFHDDSLPDTDVVISPGAGKPSSEIRRMADGIRDDGLSICRSGERECGKLEGTRNEQGKVAADHDALFVHLETSRSVRDDEQLWPKLFKPIADELTK
ncbi:hypothetical protein LWC34_15730 [Kibdelosporangium philippinense]|uniref:Secreted protein n=1 Tax=Kibdelosporangium philippinense TaxID=211113 RepID=A0ABS8Z8R6_9PSEU|nr:hypothetical protein [Kibdelosporangium philippinense]MCE7004275.1 hypothetical protein [Kibdelosporangium philippinense]